MATLLSEHGIERVVAVDDYYAISWAAAAETTREAHAAGELNDQDLAAAADALADAGRPALLAQALEIGAPDLVGQALDADWDHVEPDTARDLAQLLSVRHPGDGTSPVRRDAEALTALRGLLPRRVAVTTLSFREWSVRRDEFLAEASGMLLLLDRDGRNEGLSPDAGEQELRYAKDATGDQGLVVLLTHTVTNWDDEERVRRALTVHPELADGRFLVLAKDRLIGDAANAFPRALRVALLTPVLDDLRSRVEDALAVAQRFALDKLGDLSPHDLASLLSTGPVRKDGVWEPDVLLRLVAALERTQLRSSLRSDESVHALARRLRAVSSLSARLAGPNTRTIWELQALEYFDAAADVNALLLPPELGDIYELTEDRRDPKAPRWVILVGQACDLTVRSTGLRSNGASSFTVVPLRQTDRLADDIGGGGEPHFELPHFPRPGVMVEARLTVEHVLPAAALDYASLSVNGDCELALAASGVTDRLTPYWQARDKVLRKDLAAIVGNWQAWTTGEQSSPEASHATLLRGLVGLPNPALVQPALVDGTLSFGLRRVGRLREPYSTALLQRYNARRARLAIEAALGPGDD